MTGNLLQAMQLQQECWPAQHRIAPVPALFELRKLTQHNVRVAGKHTLLGRYSAWGCWSWSIMMLSASNLHQGSKLQYMVRCRQHARSKDTVACKADSPIMGCQQLTKAGSIPCTALEGSFRYVGVVAANQYCFLAHRLKWHGCILMAVLWRWQARGWNEGSSIWQLYRAVRPDPRWCLQD